MARGPPAQNFVAAALTYACVRSFNGWPFNVNVSEGAMEHFNL